MLSRSVAALLLLAAAVCNAQVSFGAPEAEIVLVRAFFVVAVVVVVVVVVGVVVMFEHNSASRVCASCAPGVTGTQQLCSQMREKKNIWTGL